MPLLTALDLISTPVPVLAGRDLHTVVGVSGDDPLVLRHASETFRVLVSVYDTDGCLADRIELDPVGPGQRRLIDVSELLAPRGFDADVLAVVHRVPVSIAPPGTDPTIDVPAESAPSYEMYRSLVQLGVPGGGRGGVIYETPPRMNDNRGRTRPATALMFTSKVAIGARTTTLICALNPSLDPAYRSVAPLRMQLFRADGTLAGQHETSVGPFGVATVDAAEVLRDPAARHEDGWRNHSVTAWSSAAALVFLVITLADGQVAVEHTHPPQAYLLPDEEPKRFAIKNAAIAAWDRRFEASCA